jgi:hypothetical protein
MKSLGLLQSLHPRTVLKETRLASQMSPPVNEATGISPMGIVTGISFYLLLLAREWMSTPVISIV